MNKGIIYYTKIREEYAGAHMEHMIAEKLLETALRKEFNIDLNYEPRVCILADQEVGIDVQVHRKANYERMLRRMVPEEQYAEIMAGADAEQKFFEQWVLREAYIKWTGDGLSRDLRTISMDEGSHMLLDIEEGYSGALWAMNPMEISWKFEDIVLLG